MRIVVVWDHVVKGLLVLFFAVGVLPGAGLPNILWIVSEDNSPFWLGCYGNEQARTPRLDALAAEGVVFQNAYSNAPVCAVARATILMGAYSPAMGTQHMRSRHKIPTEYKSHAEHMRELGYYCQNPGKTDYNIAMNDGSIWDKSLGEKWADVPEGKPFFTIFNIKTTHESSLFPRKPMTPVRLKPDGIKLPEYLPNLPEIRNDFARYHDRMSQMDGEAGRILDELAKSGKAEDTIVFYYGDHGGPTPRGKRYLEDTGVKVPMIVRFPEKWKKLSPFQAGERSDEIVAFVDLAPTILSLAGMETPAPMQGRAFLGKHRKEPAADAMAFLYADRFDELYGMRRGMTDGRWKYIRRFSPHLPAAPYSFFQFSMPSWRAWEKAWKAGKLSGYHKHLWEAPQAGEELFDTESDPWEVRNLAGEPELAEKLAGMRGHLKSRMEEIKDTGIVPEPLFDEMAGGGTIADSVRRDSLGYSARLDLAFAASSGDPSNIPRLVEALGSDDPVTRYWGVTGLLVLGDAAGDQAGKVQVLLEDEASAVRTTAAEALEKWGERPKARKALLTEIDRDLDEWSMLNALNTIRRLGMIGDISQDWRDKVESRGDYTKRLIEQARR